MPSPDPAKWAATIEVESARAAFVKAMDDLAAAQDDYLAALRDLADYDA
jgi:hypothetical protein